MENLHGLRLGPTYQSVYLPPSTQRPLAPLFCTQSGQFLFVDVWSKLDDFHCRAAWMYSSIKKQTWTTNLGLRVYLFGGHKDWRHLVNEFQARQIEVRCSCNQYEIEFREARVPNRRKERSETKAGFQTADRKVKWGFRYSIPLQFFSNGSICKHCKLSFDSEGSILQAMYERIFKPNLNHMQNL